MSQEIIKKISEEYDSEKDNFLIFQQEVYAFLTDLLYVNSGYDIYDIQQRPNNNIKELSSIMKNIKERPEKYKNIKSLHDINDIAGVRVICHCSSDRDVLFDFLEGQLKTKYLDVKGQKKSEGYYHACHFNFYKGENGKKFFCEIQLRTVLSNAWAIQDNKYIYKNKVVEGESQVLSIAISNILQSCENLWELVKKKNGHKEIDLKAAEFQPFQKNIDSEISSVDRNSQNFYSEGRKKWFDVNKEKTLEKINELGIDLYIEIMACFPINKEFNGIVLYSAARESQIHTFGWPIGIFMEGGNRDFKPRATADGICAEIAIKEQDINDKEIYRYDYWAIKKDASFYMIKSLFERSRSLEYIYFNTRIVRITETLMYLSNLYRKLEIDENLKFELKIKYSGIKDKKMGATSNRIIYEERKSLEDVFVKRIAISISDIEEKLPNVVKEIMDPFFELFDFFEVKDHIYEEIVNNFKQGKIT